MPIQAKPQLNPDGTVKTTGAPPTGYFGTAVRFVNDPLGTLRAGTDKLGLTAPAPPDLSKGPDAEALRTFAGNLVKEYEQRQPGVAPKIDQQRSDEARGYQIGALDDLRGVASGETKTAADALLQKGVDQAAGTAMGTAAAYSAGNPTMALRRGLSAGADIGNKAAADAAMLKATEQAAARNAILSGAGQTRQGDITTAAADQGATLTQAQIDAQREDALRRAAAAGLLGPLAAAQANQQIQQQNAAGNQVAIGSILGGAGNIVSRFIGSRSDDDKPDNTGYNAYNPYKV